MNEPQTYVDLQDAGNAQAQLILQAIARHANWDTGLCWPGDDAIARMAKCSTRTVQTHLAKLEHDGLISREDRRSVRGTKQARIITLTGYAEWISALREGGQVRKPKAVAKYEQPPERLSGGPPENIAVTTGSLPSVTTGRQAAGQERYTNTQLTKDTPLPPRGDERAQKALPKFGKLEALECFSAYNATALELGLPQAAKLTPDRERRIVARLKDYGLEGWHKAIGNLRASKFLTGGTDIGFRADLDFVCQAKSFGKLHDGGYAGGRNATRSTSSHEPVLTVAPKKYAMSEAEFEARKEQIGREVWEADQAFGKANNPGTTVQ